MSSQHGPARHLGDGGDRLQPPACTAESAAISGCGEGLDCSIEPIVEGLAFRRGPGKEPVNLQYRKACVAHDYRYRHGAATYGYAQAQTMVAATRALVVALVQRSSTAEEIRGSER